MVIRMFRRRGSPKYQSMRDEIVSLVPKKISFEIRIPPLKRALVTMTRRSVYIIDTKGVRRRIRSTRVRFGGSAK